MTYIGAAFVPLFICVTVATALFRRLDAFALFTEGAREGLSVVLKIAPSTIGFIVAVGMLSASGALDAPAALLSPITAKLGFPPEVQPLVILRPVSGGAVALLENILSECGADSAAGRLASVICGGSETTFYAIAVLLRRGVNKENTLCRARRDDGRSRRRYNRDASHKARLITLIIRFSTRARAVFK